MLASITVMYLSRLWLSSMQSKRYVTRRCDKGGMDDNTVYVGQICDVALHVFGENPKGFLVRNKDPSLWKKEFKSKGVQVSKKKT